MSLSWGNPGILAENCVMRKSASKPGGFYAWFWWHQWCWLHRGWWARGGELRHIREVLARTWLVRVPPSLRRPCLFFGTRTHTACTCARMYTHTNTRKHRNFSWKRFFPHVRKYLPECFKWAGMNFIDMWTYDNANIPRTTFRVCLQLRRSVPLSVIVKAVTWPEGLLIPLRLQGGKVTGLVPLGEAEGPLCFRLIWPQAGRPLCVLNSLGSRLI